MSSSSGASGKTVHQPVLVREVIRLLGLEPGLTVVEGTVGGGGHARRILQEIGPEGTLIGLDRDAEMIARAQSVLAEPNCHLRQASYSELRTVLDDLDVRNVDRILLDLGLSSDQLADDRRGFGFDSTAGLDMRFDPQTGRPASELLATATKDELADIFQRYGDELHHKRIAAEIIRRRSSRPITSARELSELVADVLPATSRRGGRHPATQVFQALRIAVNEELRHLELTLNQVFRETLRVGGRAAVITFHSLEDRLVKSAFRDREQWENLTPKPITATAVEKKMNPRSRAAKLRAAVLKTAIGDDSA